MAPTPEGSCGRRVSGKYLTPSTCLPSVHDLLAAVDAEDLGGDVAVGHQVHGAQRAVLGVADAAVVDSTPNSMGQVMV